MAQTPTPRTSKPLRRLLLRGLWALAGLVLAITLWYFWPCAAPEVALPTQTNGGRRLYVIQQNLHTGLAWARTDDATESWINELLPEPMPYVEVGWGDRAYYFANDRSLWSIARLLVVPSPSALQIAGLPLSPRKFFSDPVATIELSPVGFAAVQRFIRATLTTPPEPLGAGKYGSSRFYAAAPAYVGWYNCNTWAAEALRHGGVPLCPHRMFFASQIRQHLLKFAVRLLPSFRHAPVPSP
ncbi:MAG: DUF2459 domain-containing protein [Oscillatoriales cyanobacterium SM2_2_1]|nr:DUF2459 domain-containing protein [Oscillatoriales cyanobacterium SM2_2_1]